MTRRKLPAGIQSFRKLREQDCYYVDKTAHIHRLVTQCNHCFLSRPRRFGKSLLVDTLKELFEGNEPLFRGLAIHDKWDWTVRHPVLRLSFAGGSFRKPGSLEAYFDDQLTDLEDAAGVTPRQATPAHRLAGLIRALHDRIGQRVVVLVDECSRPIANALVDAQVAEDHRAFLRGVYATVKDCDAQVRFSFFTGVSKANGLCDLNNLTDITFDRSFGAICGYTEDEYDAVFAAELDGLDRTAMRDWYGGYRWRGDGETVYNPSAVLQFLQSREFHPYWFETGTPAFLPAALFGRQIDPAALPGVGAGWPELAGFDIQHQKTEALLFHTGYLTIVDEEHSPVGRLSRLGYPNRDVRSAMDLLIAMAEGAESAATAGLPRSLFGFRRGLHARPTALAPPMPVL